MNRLTEGAVELVDELVVLLDREIELLDKRHAQLEELSRATVRRDDEVLDPLLEQIERTQQVQTRTDLKLQALRSTLAATLGWAVAETRLARLIERLDGPRAAELDYRRQQIILLSERLKRQHMATVLVVTECARINRMLLESFFPEKRAVTTYGARGQSSWGLDVGLVDVES